MWIIAVSGNPAMVDVNGRWALRCALLLWPPSAPSYLNPQPPPLNRFQPPPAHPATHAHQAGACRITPESNHHKQHHHCNHHPYHRIHQNGNALQRRIADLVCSWVNPVMHSRTARHSYRAPQNNVAWWLSAIRIMHDFVSGLPVSFARSVLSLVRWRRRAHKYVCHANDHPSCVFSLKWCVWSQQEAAVVCPNQVARVRRSYKWSHLILDARARSKRLIGKGLHLPNWASVSGCVGQVSVNKLRWKAGFYFDIERHGAQCFCDQCVCFTWDCCGSYYWKETQQIEGDL